MKVSRLAALVAISFATGAVGTALAQVKVGVVYAATGPGAFVGIPQKNTAALLPRKIGDITVEYIERDDASDPTQSVQIVKRLISEHKIDALVGPSLTPNGVANVPVVAEAATPALMPSGSAAVVLPMDDKKRWVFKTTQNDDIICGAIIEHMVKVGIKTLGFIGYNDPYGENWFKVFSAQAEKAGMKIVANERYSRSDSSVTGQVLKLVAAKPDAILVAGVAAGAALPHGALTDAGYKGRIYQTHGAATPDFLKIGGKKVDGALMAASLMLVLDQIPDSNPSKRVAQGYMGAYERIYGNKPATFGANVFDAGMLLQRAIPEAAKKAKPGTPEFRAALRDSLESTKELVATQGVYNMTPQDHSGFDQRGRVMMTLKDGVWRLTQD